MNVLRKQFMMTKSIKGNGVTNMKIESYNPSVFKDLFDTISHIINECKMEFHEDGLKINALDQSHIVFISVDLHYSFFDSYDVPAPETVIVDSNELINVLRRCGNTDTLEMMTDDSNLILTFKGDATKTFRIRLIDNDYDTPTPPAIDYNVNLKIPSNLIKDTLSDLKLFSDNYRISVDGDYFRMFNTGGFGDTETKYIHGANVTEYVEAGYAIDKTMDIFRLSKLSPEVQVKLGNNIPVTFTFPIGNRDGEVSFLLAPRIDEGGV